MPPRPIQYGNTQYPRKYRPLMYGTHGPTEPPAAPPRPDQSRRRRFLVLLAVLLATLLLHAGIAYALRSPSAATPSRASIAAAQHEACQKKPGPSTTNDTTPTPEEAPNPGSAGSDARQVL